jgi:hypothetical protein
VICEEAIEDAAVGDVNLDPRDVERPESRYDKENDLQVGRVRPRSDDVKVTLSELPIAPALGILTAKDLTDVKPFEGEVQLVAVKRHVPGEGNGQIKAHRHITLPVVGKPVDLLVRLATTLSKEHVGILKDRRIDGDKSERRKPVLQRACQRLTS